LNNDFLMLMFDFFNLKFEYLLKIRNGKGD
jgi:hypothetical protein